MAKTTAIGIDLAKNVFQIHGVDELGRAIIKRKVSRSGLSKFVSTLEPCLIGVEASGGARFWVREFKKFGHDARMIPPQFVKPFVKSEKNDANDAEAICEAVQRPNMRFVAEKTMEQQDIQMLHRIRNGLVGHRTEMVNELRAIMGDYGIIAAKGIFRIREKTREVLSDEASNLSPIVRHVMEGIVERLRIYDEEINNLEKKLDEVFKAHEVCRRLISIPGVGKITATAIIGTVPHASHFKSGRHLSAWLGLVPRQNSSGGKQKLSGITKRGDTYLRTLLIHGGRTVVQHATKKADKRSQWISEKIKTRGKNKTAVAVANKNARVIWKILKTEEVFRTA
jgi:transposase